MYAAAHHPLVRTARYLHCRYIPTPRRVIPEAVRLAGQPAGRAWISWPAAGGGLLIRCPKMHRQKVAQPLLPAAHTSAFGLVERMAVLYWI